MSGPYPVPIPDQQQEVNVHFSTYADYWKDVYGEDSFWGTIYRERRAIALGWVDQLGLPAGARVLEVGCGAGLLALDLVARGCIVDAIDASSDMVEITQRLAAQADVGTVLTVSIGDVHALQFPADSYDLVVALGVLPWLYSPATAAMEMGRVTRPGGFVLVTADNLLRLNFLIDPRYSLLSIQPVRRVMRRVMRRWHAPRRNFEIQRHTPGMIRHWLQRGSLATIRQVTLGFGPFSLLGRELFSNPSSIRIHKRLQARADHGAALLRSTGVQIIVLAQKR